MPIGLFTLQSETLEMGRRLADISYAAQQKAAATRLDAIARLENIALAAEQLAAKARTLCEQAREGR